MVGFLLKYPSIPLEIKETVEALEVKDPIEVLDYPAGFDVYPGEIVDFEVAVNNLASINYSVRLVFSLQDLEYQST